LVANQVTFFSTVTSRVQTDFMCLEARVTFQRVHAKPTVQLLEGFQDHIIKDFGCCIDYGVATPTMSPSLTLSECMGSASFDSNTVAGIGGLLQDHVGPQADDGSVPIHTESTSSDLSP
jgi:hypothetical protein